jgi:2-alkenal reductase
MLVHARLESVLMSEITPTPPVRRGVVRRSLSTGLVGVLSLLMVAVGAYSFNVAGAAEQTAYEVQLTAQEQDNATATATNETATTYQSVADVAEAVNPAVVTIYTYTSQAQSQQETLQPRGSDNGNQPSEPNGGDEVALGAGSGWIYSADGYVVTNAHVVAGADAFTVRFHDGTEVEAELVGTDVFQDVAVLKLNLADGQEVPGVAAVGDSSAMRAGDEVVALGSPLGEFTNSVSDGIIGGLDRSLDTGEGYRLGNLIQHDADISSGNSGGPLVNMQGQVVGMNVAKIDSSMTTGASVSGLNFAIDGNTVAGIVDEIIASGESVVYPYLGIQSQWDGEGQVVQSVEAGSPAADAGIEGGDVIVAVDGDAVSDEVPLINLLFAHRPGDVVTVSVDRGGDQVDLQVTLGERPDDLTA